jgi:hypothetical protein
VLGRVHVEITRLTYSNVPHIVIFRVTVVSSNESNPEAGIMRVWGRWSAWLCLSLLLWTAAAESTHHHPSQTEAVSCSICAVAHTASPAATASSRSPVFAAVGLCHDKETVAQARVSFSELEIRGPPVVL